MAKSDPNLERLLRASAGWSEPTPEMPFGFDTRVVALARAAGGSRGSDAWELARLVRRVAVFSIVVTVFASSAAYWQLTDDETVEPYANAYAIADTALAEEFSP